MAPMTLAQLSSELKPALGEEDLQTMIAGVEYDSRRIKPGQLFVALAGGYADGHDYAAGAAERGAAALLVERNLPVDLPQVVVPNTRQALAVVAANFYRHPSRELTVIGVTGTDGKTTTSHLIEDIFVAAGAQCGVIGTIGVRIGDRSLDAQTRQTTPESIDVQRHLRAMVESGTDYAVIEATSHGLDLHRLDETHFSTGAVTNITLEHLEHHKTIAAYRRAKGILFERVGEGGGNAVVNADDEGARAMLGYASGARVMTYSTDGDQADLRASEINLGAGGSAFTLTHGESRFRIDLPLVGLFNVANALCAIGVAISHDISPEICRTALATARQVPGRMESIKENQPFSVIVDYAHTPASLEKVLQLLRGLTSGRLLLAMGSAGERDREKRPMQGRVAVDLADYSVFTTEDPRFEDADAIIAEIAAGADAAGAIEGQHYRRIVDRSEAIHHLLSVAEPGDCVLLAGKGHERSIIWGAENRPWDEAAVARDVLSSMGFREERA
jgi:UDP-N-acetylmuramoyl-L-alanyl-D-glutamate--2,6-diaminopimelate ligase